MNEKGKVQMRSANKMKSILVIFTTHPVNKGGFDRLRWTRLRRIDAIHGRVKIIKGGDPEGMAYDIIIGTTKINNDNTMTKSFMEKLGK
ncbi:hypothetical protein OSB04_025181 [Centaurea solstitialis]|uniref:Uncharacterized protein n=1 Tax=Centaurea solstitialis TaxID=347529 RepID=A0AA38SMM7_9ASTR|nr:hypothetical protein OSB04_025181 [Centaurea solstitialis]